MKTQVKIRGVKEMSARLMKVIEDSRRDEVILKSVGEKAVAYIQANTKARREEYRVEDVSKGWARSRAKLAGSNRTDETYLGSTSAVRSSRKSGKSDDSGYWHGRFSSSAKQTANNIFTGEWLSSLTATIKSASVELFFGGMHSRYKDENGKAIGLQKTNDQIHREMKAKGRDVLFLSEKLRDILETEIVRNVRRRIKLYQTATKRLK